VARTRWGRQFGSEWDDDAPRLERCLSIGIGGTTEDDECLVD
jgi:hypothetical protein